MDAKTFKALVKQARKALPVTTPHGWIVPLFPEYYTPDPDDWRNACCLEPANWEGYGTARPIAPKYLHMTPGYTYARRCRCKACGGPINATEYTTTPT